MKKWGKQSQKVKKDLIMCHKGNKFSAPPNQWCNFPLQGVVYKMLRKRSVAIELRLRAEAEARREAREKLKMILVR